MPVGPGKYDDACTLVRELTAAEGVVLAVVGGDRGNGFDAQVQTRRAPAEVGRALVALLRSVADQIEADLKD